MENFNIGDIVLSAIALIVVGIIVGIRIYKHHSERKDFERRYNEAAQKKKESDAKIRMLEERYQDNPIILKVAERFTDRFIESIEKLDRDVRKENIRYHDWLCMETYCTEGLGGFYEATETCGRIKCFHPYHDGVIFSFYSENLQALQSIEEMKAFVKASASCAVKMIKEKYPMDESGTRYELITEENTHIELWKADEDFRKNIYTYRFSVEFTYTAPNGNYQPPTEW